MSNYHFTRLPHILWRNGVKICGSNYARDVLISLMDFEQNAGDEVFPTDETLASINGVSTKTIQRARHELIARELIKVRTVRTRHTIKYYYRVQHEKLSERLDGFTNSTKSTMDYESETVSPVKDTHSNSRKRRFRNDLKFLDGLDVIHGMCYFTDEMVETFNSLPDKSAQYDYMIESRKSYTEEKETQAAA